LQQVAAYRTLRLRYDYAIGGAGMSASDVAERPRSTAPIAETIPAELKARRQWVVWRNEPRKGKWSKVPYTPGTLNHAKSNAPSTWRTFAEALSCYHERPDYFDGIGYVFSKDDPFVGGDIDHCIDVAGEIGGLAATHLPPTYAEISPSGSGIKFIGQRRVWPQDRTRRAV
jgi:putative DNA primase/helicase